MYRQQLRILVGFLMLSEAGAVVLTGILALWITGAAPHGDGPSRPFWLAGLWAILILTQNFVLLKLQMYAERRPSTYRQSVLKIGAATTVSFAILMVFLFTTGATHVPRGYLLLHWLLLTLAVCGIRLFMDFYLRTRQDSAFNCRQILIVGSGRRADLVNRALGKQRSWGHQVVGFLTPSNEAQKTVYGCPCLGEVDDLWRILEEQSVDEVIFALPESFSRSIKPFLDICMRKGTDFIIMPLLYDPGSMVPLRAENLQDIPVLVKNMSPLNPSGRLYKRLLDYAAGAVGAVLFAAMYPLVALAIRLDSPGPVLFRQTRVGLNGRTFTMYKFRTMHVDAEARKDELAARNEMDGVMFKMENDPRVTRVGRWLRRTSLDEFPQFINVLRGEMSLVGTRPPTPDEVRRYNLGHHRRLSIRPGVTGLWQISGRSDISNFEDIVALDCAYIDNWRFINDLEIVLKTVKIVFLGRGAC